MGRTSDIRLQPITNDTRSAVSATLRITANMDQGSIEFLMKKIDEAWCLANTLDLPDTPSATKNELKRFDKAITRFVKEIRLVSHQGNFAMWDAAGEQSDDTRLANFDGDGKFGSDLSNLLDSAEIMQKAARLALDRIVSVKKPPNVRARHFAVHVAVALEEVGTKATTTKNGPYFSILDQLFAELLPTEKGAAFQRYGQWALKAPVLDEYFVNFDYIR